MKNDAVVERIDGDANWPLVPFHASMAAYGDHELSPNCVRAETL